MNKQYKLSDLTDIEVGELQRCEGVKFVSTTPMLLHNSQVTDDYGNEVKPQRYKYNVVVEIIPSTEERESKIETFISSLTYAGKDHRIDKFSREFRVLKEELGISKRKIPTTLGESLNEFKEKYINE